MLQISLMERSGKGGTILNIGSASGLYPAHFVPVYGSTKSKLLSYLLIVKTAVIWYGGTRAKYSSYVNAIGLSERWSRDVHKISLETERERHPCECS